MGHNTDIVLLPALELVPVEEIPKQRSKELVSLKERRSEALFQSSLSFILMMSVGSLIPLFGWSVWVALAALSFGAYLLSGIGFVAASIGFTSILRMFIAEVRDFRRAAISPQLTADANEEAVVSLLVEKTNQDITNWNMAAETVKQYDPGNFNLPPLDLRRLHKSRDKLFARRLLVKKAISNVSRKTEESK